MIGHFSYRNNFKRAPVLFLLPLREKVRMRGDLFFTLTFALILTPLQIDIEEFMFM